MRTSARPSAACTWALGLLALALLGAGCGHGLDDGHYVVTATSIDADPCALTSAGGTALGTGNLTVNGEEVIFAYGVSGLVFHGLFKQPVYGKPDSFSADATAAQVSAALSGTGCPADFVQAHLNGDLDTPTRFSGALSLSYTLTSSPGEDPSCRPSGGSCPLQVHYVAQKTSAP